MSVKSVESGTLHAKAFRAARSLLARQQRGSTAVRRDRIGLFHGVLRFPRDHRPASEIRPAAGLQLAFFWV